MSRRGPDAATQIARALCAGAAAAGAAVRVTATASRAWASATFEGARHRFVLEGTAAAALDDWLAALPEAEFRLWRTLVADVAVTARAQTGDVATATVEVLTVDEA